MMAAGWATETASLPWTHEETIGMADARCVYCHGDGLCIGNLVGRRGPVACKCVLRSIFRACYNRYRECCEPTAGGSIALEFHAKRIGGRSYSRPRENFIADFCLIAGRTLPERQLDLFRLFFLRGHDWKTCVRYLRVGRGNFFHEVYAVEQALGRAFRDTRPYGLWPLQGYFAGVRGMEAREKAA